MMSSRCLHRKAGECGTVCLWRCVVLLLLFATSLTLEAQEGVGAWRLLLRVQDALNNTPLQGVQITARDTLLVSNKQGEALLQLEPTHIAEGGVMTLVFSKTGYQGLRYLFVPQSSDTLTITLQPQSNSIATLEVLGQRSQYDVNNPAAALITTLVTQRYQQPPRLEYTTRVYDQLTLSVANFDLNNRLLNRLVPFFHYYVIPSKLDQRWALPLSMRESVSDLGYHPSSEEPKEIVRWRQRIGVDANIDDGTMTQNLEEIFPRIDIFRNDIKLLDYRFVSPLSTSAHRYYRYYLTDTVVRAGFVTQEIEYYPISPRSLAFRGRLYVTLSDTPQVVASELEVPSDINLNFVKALRLVQHYDVESLRPQAVRSEEMQISMMLFRRLLSLYAEHSRTYTHPNYTTPDTLITRSLSSVTDLSRSLDAQYYAEYGSIYKGYLSSPQGLREFLERVRSVPLYRTLIEVGEMVGTGYVRTDYAPTKLYGGSKFDIGPLASMYGRNDIEGHRLRIGGRSTGYLSPYFFFGGYLAYGMLDKQWKSELWSTISLHRKRYFVDEYPLNAFTLRYTRDLFTPGQMYESGDKDNIFHNLGTAYLTSRSYRTAWHADYTRDIPLAGLRFTLFADFAKDRPTGSLRYLELRSDSTYYTHSSMRDASVGITLRYAPGERNYQGTPTQSRRLRRDAPIFYLSHTASLKALKGDFNYHRTELSVEQRLWLSTFGYVDYYASVGKIWHRLPFPLLFTPPANAAFSYNARSFQLLRPLAYVGDEHAMLFLNYHVMGALLNRIPFVSKLSMRGVFSFSALWGNTSSLNSLANSPNLMLLPNTTEQMHQLHHLEMGVGLENIFRVLRIDLFMPLTTCADTPKWALKGSLRLSF